MTRGLSMFGYDSWRDAAADLVLGKADWERAREGYEENDWGRLLGGAALGTMAVAGLAPVGLGRKAGRAALGRTLAGEAAEAAPRLGTAGRLADDVAEEFLTTTRHLDDWSPGGLVDTPLGPVPEAMPNVRGAWSAGDEIAAGRENLLAQRQAGMDANPMLDPEFLDTFAQQLVADPMLDEVMRSMAPLGRPGAAARFPGGDLYGKQAGSGGVLGRDMRQVTEGGRPLGPLSDPLSEGGLAIEPSLYLEPEMALSDLAATWASSSGNAKAAAKRQFAREFARTNQAQLSMLDSSMYDGPRFYVDRASQIDRAASQVTTSAGEPAFSPAVVAVASAASSASAPPILEPIRLMVGLPYVRWKGGKAVFGPEEMAAFAKDFPSAAKGNFIKSGVQSFVEAVNNPNFLDRKFAGLAHKTHPYALLGVDPLNPHAFVADRNFWYLANGHSWGNTTRLGRARTVASASQTSDLPMRVSDPMPRGMKGSLPTTSVARAQAKALGVANPATLQEVEWFGPRIIQQASIEDSFQLVPGESMTTLRNWLGDDVVARLGAPGEPVDWGTLMGEALERAGSHWGDLNVRQLRTGAASANRQFMERVAAGREPGWTLEVIDGLPRAIPDRSRWDLTLAPADRFTGKTLERAAEVGGVSNLPKELVAFTRQLPNGQQLLDTVVPQMAEFLQGLTRPQQMRAVAFLAAGGGAWGAAEMDLLAELFASEQATQGVV